MKILVLLRMVPDVIEELEVASDGKSLDVETLRLIINESDNHALEQSLLLKERHGGKVTAVALEAPEIDDVLFTALAKGVDRAVKITGVDQGLTTRRVASILSQVLPTVPGALPADLILTGCQAIDDLDGQVDCGDRDCRGDAACAAPVPAVTPWGWVALLVVVTLSGLWGLRRRSA